MRVCVCVCVEWAEYIYPLTDRHADKQNSCVDAGPSAGQSSTMAG